MARIDTLLRLQNQFTGIDFVRVLDACTQTTLRIYFLTELNVLVPPFAGATSLKNIDIVITGDLDKSLSRPKVTGITSVAGNQAQFDATLRRYYVEFTLDAPGGFANYRLRINDALGQNGRSRIDPASNDILFSFKLGCEDGHDCTATALHQCPVEPEVDYPVDYLARDFESFRNALLDFASHRYPNWTLPLEADMGAMMAEVFAALGDELSYLQERYAREAFLETANQRRSLRKKARLLDYEIHDGRNPTTLVDLTVAGSGVLEMATPIGAVIPTGLEVQSDDGRVIPYEFGHGLFDERSYQLDEAWNLDTLLPYVYDTEKELCLPVGTTSVLVHRPKTAALEQLVSTSEPRYLLLQTRGGDGLKSRTHFARIVDTADEVDPLVENPDPLAQERSLPLTRIFLHEDDALPFELSVPRLQLSANIVFATAGKTQIIEFTAVDENGDASQVDTTKEITTVRESGLRDPVSLAPLTYHLYGIPQTDETGLGFLGDSLRSTTPEVRLLSKATGDEWFYRRTLLGVQSDKPFFTLEDGIYRAIRRFYTPSGTFVHRDYATARGYSLRFGEGQFGAKPAGAFTLRYRTGPGSSANIPAGSLRLASTITKGSLQIVSATNPVAVTSGVDPESQRDIKMLVPEAYRAETFFAVKPEDYQKQAESLSFVDNAAATQRYTGSWLTHFVTADPLGAKELTPEQLNTLEAWMDCVRQAGRDVIVKPPKILPIDLELHLCLEPNTYAHDVAQQAEEVLFGPGTLRRLKGFFHPDHFTFGTPLYRSALEAALQRIPGVKSVRRMYIRERGQREFREFRELTLAVSPDQILRLDNNPERPENGSLRIVTEGGA
jgi:hypothetical protein